MFHEKLDTDRIPCRGSLVPRRIENMDGIIIGYGTIIIQVAHIKTKQHQTIHYHVVKTKKIKLSQDMWHANNYSPWKHVSRKPSAKYVLFTLTPRPQKCHYNLPVQLIHQDLPTLSVKQDSLATWLFLIYLLSRPHPTAQLILILE